MMQCKLLTDDQIQHIHSTSLNILERTGVEVPHGDMLCRFADSGAKVDMERQRVRIPTSLVEKAIKDCGKQFTIYGRDLSRRAEFGTGKRNYNSTAGQAHWVDAPGKPRRFVCLDDVAVAARFADALEHLNVAGAMADPHELPAATRCVAVMATMLRNTSKPLHFWYYDRRSARFLNEIMIAIRGDKLRAAQYPLCYPFLEPISPLRFPVHGIDLLYETAELNLPVSIGPMAQMGLSAPMSIAGTMAQENAEILAGICITQLVRPGLPVCYGGICHAFDMQTTQMIFSGPEQAIFGVGMTQMGKHYGLPVYINMGMTDSKRPDAQAGLEVSATLALGAAAGADIFGHLGIVGVDQASSLQILLLQEEIIGYVERIMQSVEISDEALGLDLIDQTSTGGTFIDTEHTAERFRRELWFPKLLDRNFYQIWLDGGAISCEQRCCQHAEQVQSRHKPEPLAAELERSLTQIVASATRELQGNLPARPWPGGPAERER